MDKNSVFSSLKELLAENPVLSQDFSSYFTGQPWEERDVQGALNKLSEIICSQNYTIRIAQLFSPLLLELLTRASKICDDGPVDCYTKHELLCIALSKLLWKFPEVGRFAKIYFENSRNLFWRLEGDDNEPPTKKIKMDAGYESELLQAAYIFLLYDLDYFKDLWSWSFLAHCLVNNELKGRWYAYQCLCLVGNLKDNEASNSLEDHFTIDQIISCTKEVSDMSSLWNLKTFSSHGIALNDCCVTVDFALSPEIVDVCGVLLTKYKDVEQSTTDKMIIVPSLKQTLHSLALAVSSSEPVLLQGLVGCGKTSIIESLASKTGRVRFENFFKVQLGDHMDSKTLLGTHCCTEIPGQFVWKPGILIRAMSQGHWLLLEDIDCAPKDVVSLLVPVLQSRTIMLPGHSSPIRAAPGFQLFATQRLFVGKVGSYSEFKKNAEVISKQWRTIVMSPLSVKELHHVISTKWAMLQSIIGRIIDIYSPFSSDFKDGPTRIEHHGRFISMRDLFKFCDRIAHEFDPANVEVAVNAFRNALDCFCEHIPKMDRKIELGMSVAVKFNIPKEKAAFFCQFYKPAIENEDRVVVGRAQLPKKPREVSFTRDVKSTFANTRLALCLLEKVAVSILNKEPVLLVGETGTGKTSIVQHLAESTNQKLTVINMSQQSDSVDLLGGYKPVDISVVLKPLKEEFEHLLEISLDPVENEKFMKHVSGLFLRKSFKTLLDMMLITQEKVTTLLLANRPSALRIETIGRWRKFTEKVQSMKQHKIGSGTPLAFKFVEGALVKAMKNGEWLLLDEINLAEAETLECLAGVLEKDDNILLLEKGDCEPIHRHPDFHIFACMNPATDIGKKDLPTGIRSRFTEFFVEEISEKNDLIILVQEYLKSLSLQAVTFQNIVDFYFNIRKLASEKLSDGTGHHPYYSLRTLCRALSFAATNPCHNIPRSLYEAFCLSFLSQLDNSSHSVVTETIKHMILDQRQLSILRQSIPEPKGTKCVNVGGYWIGIGKKEIEQPEDYIFTDTVKRNLQDLARIVSAGTYPILLQGETSCGKTSMIQYLAKITGNVCVRVNNHEHTDIQEYVGTYSANKKGKLVFKEGILVEAMRKGYWIILDELNLAPTEVMEALNRVLDDNRELFIAETQTLVKAHPGFIVFATQNPPGLYGGRKILSRAFRNRFIELHFSEIPPPELEIILEKKCKLPASYNKKLVSVMQELQMRRRESGVFAGKQGFITLRDLFRWGDRYQHARDPDAKFYDWDQHLADEGYLLLAGRVRFKDEVNVIKTVIQNHLKREIIPDNLFNLSENTSFVTRNLLESFINKKLPPPFEHIVWTYSMRRLGVLVGKAMEFEEPALLVGNTGCGKTTICQIYAILLGQDIYSVNCHMHSESADFLGGLRPNRNPNKEKSKLFEWVDGPLISAMQTGSFFLADEISLADDSVLERLNSVLEPEQKILLSEKSFDCKTDSEIKAESGFQFFATMNPGGDFGKKELSPALRNRFTEIWCPSSLQVDTDVINIINHSLQTVCKLNTKGFNIAGAIVNFLNFYRQTDVGRRVPVTLRDVLTWVEFIKTTFYSLSPEETYMHGGILVFLDSLESGFTVLKNEPMYSQVKNDCLSFMEKQIGNLNSIQTWELILPDHYQEQFENHSIKASKNASDDFFGIGPFQIGMGTNEVPMPSSFYNFNASTPKQNAMRILRAMQLQKPILLEGNPGVGKSSLVSALAKAAGYDLVRINLSEQTDISDLFGADLPVEGGKIGEFAWHDGPLLQALQKGQWILLDEMNLASQSVLEGLNACFDHRREIYISELGITFSLENVNTRMFACQNPYKHGGSRKGLPRSFLNRFTQVYVEPMTSFDLEDIAATAYGKIPRPVIKLMNLFNHKLNQQVNVYRNFGLRGSPWEFNLRDLLRWCEAVQRSEINSGIGEFVKLIYADRMRTYGDKEKVYMLFNRISAEFPDLELQITNSCLDLNVFEECIQLGNAQIKRKNKRWVDTKMTCIAKSQLSTLESIMKCIEMNWMPILVGPSGSGKSTLVRLLSDLSGNKLHILSVNSEMDTIELLGGFEQVDINRKIESIAQDLETVIHEYLSLSFREFSEAKAHRKGAGVIKEILSHIHFLSTVKENSNDKTSYKRKLNGIMQLVESLKNVHLNRTNSVLCTCKNDVEHLLKRLDSEDLLSGGQFEWVDSILIHAAVKGHWLLIDDANFCSPSVLDRLNGLLEPNGVLTISEQGSVLGDLRVIEPHPDFRIILTMNPQNGEISRAMRNRGIEIYVDPLYKGTTDINILSDWRFILDIVSFSQCRNFAHSSMIRTLIKLHADFDSSQIVGGITVSDFYSAATLGAQLLLKHVDPRVTLIKMCDLVYGKNLSLQRKNEVLKGINEQMNNYSEILPDIEIPVIKMLPTSIDYRQHSIISFLKKQTAPFMFFLRSLELNIYRQDGGEVSPPFGAIYPDVGPSTAKLAQRFFGLLRIMFESCPCYLLAFLSTWLYHMLQHNIQPNSNDRLKHICLACLKFAEQLMKKTETPVSKRLHKAVHGAMFLAGFSDYNDRDLPIDPRWKPYIYRKILRNLKLRPGCDDHDDIVEIKMSNYANRYNLDLYYKTLECMPTKGGPGSIKLSNAVEIKKMAEDHKSILLSLIPNVSKVLGSLKTTFSKLIEDELPVFTDDIFWSLHEILYALFGCTRILDTPVEKTLPAVEFQIKYFTPNFISLRNKVLKLYETDSFQRHPDQSIARDFGFIDKFLKIVAPESAMVIKYPQRIGFSLGYINDREAKLCFSIQEIFTVVDLVDRLKDPKSSLIDLKTIIFNFKEWSKDFFELLHKDSTNGELQNNTQKSFKPFDTEFLTEFNKVRDIKLQLEMASLIASDDEIMEICHKPPKVPTISNEELSYIIQLYPLLEYLLIIKQTDTLYSEGVNGDSAFSLSVNAEGIGLNPRFCAQKIRTSSSGPKERLAFNLNKFLYQTRCGFSSSALSCLHYNATKTIDADDKSTEKHSLVTGNWNTNYTWSKQAPLLSYICSSLFPMPCESSVIMCHSPLGVSKQSNMQLETIKRVLWGNFDKLTNPLQSSMVSSALIVLKWFNTLMNYVRDAANDVSGSFSVHSIESCSELFKNLGIYSWFITPEGNNLILLTFECVAKIKQQIRGAPDFNLIGLICQTYIYVGMVTSILLMPRDQIDPILKNKFKLECLYEKLLDLKCEIMHREWICKLNTGQDFNCISAISEHPYIQGLVTTLQDLQRKIDKMKDRIRFRSTQDKYESVKEEMHYYLSNIAPSDKMIFIASQMYLYLTEEKKPSNMECIRDIENCVRNQEEVIAQMAKKYPLYDDITVPFCLGIEQTIYGLRMLNQSVLKKEFSVGFKLKQCSSVNDFLVKFIRFNDTTLNCVDIASLIILDSNMDVFKNLLSLCNLPPSITTKLTYKLLKSAILDLTNGAKFVASRNEQQSANIMRYLMMAFTHVWKIWNLQDLQAKIRKEQEESLFVNKTKLHESELTEDQLIDQKLKAFFPSFQQDYIGCTESTEDTYENKECNGVENDPQVSEEMHLTSEDMFEIAQLYSNAMNILSSKNRNDREGGPRLFEENAGNSDYLTPYLLRHEVVCQIVKSLGDKLDSSLDAKLVPGLLLVCHRLQNSLVNKRSSYDVYRDPNPAEVTLMYPLFKDLMCRAQQLIENHKGNPHLQEIIKITERVLSFPVTDPVMKFVLGMEMLLEPLRLWNQFANSSKLTLNPIKDDIVKSIIRYRSLELNGWRISLNSVLQKQKINSSKWWFHIFNALKSSTKNVGMNEDTNFLINILKQCLEDSPLGEYSERLKILQSFLQEYQLLHSRNEKPDKNREVLFNIYTYYKQFLPEVEKKISDIRTPIEKEIKDFVKLSRWGDSNEFSVMRSTEKSHRCIVKHMKQYEDALQSPAKRVFTLPSKCVSETSDKWSLDIKDGDFISKSGEKICNQDFIHEKEALIRKIPQHYRTIRRLSKNFSKDFTVISHINTLNEFCGTIIETMEGVTLDMQKKMCTRSQEKKQALLHIQKKKQLLSTLFKNLRVIGLSYRRGITFATKRRENDVLMVAALDVTQMETLEFDLKFKKILTNSSQDVEHYFYKSIGQHRMLELAMESPSKDLTLDIIHRILGYSGDLIEYILTQRKHLVNMSENVDKMGLFLQTLTVLQSKTSKHVLLPVEKDVLDMDNSVSKLQIHFMMVVRQFSEVFHCASESTDPEKMLIKCIIDPYSKKSLFSSLQKSDGKWTDIMKALDKCLAETDKSIRQLYLDEKSSLLTTWDQFTTTSEILHTLESTINHFQLVVRKANLDDKQYMLKGFNLLHSEVENQCKRIVEIKSQLQSKLSNDLSDDNSKAKSIMYLIHRLSKEVLLGYQDIIHLCVSSAENDAPGDNVVPENLFTLKISKCISDIENGLRIEKVLKLMCKLMKRIKSAQKSVDDLEAINQALRLLGHLTPFLNQYFQLVKIHLATGLGMHRTSCKLLSILLTVFHTLATKGFCIPLDLQEEAEKSGATKFEDIESGGLGEGEGTKDVSETIETEDQLEDTFKDGEEREKKEDESDIKEEEKGIEMSEDFEGKSYDPEKGKDQDKSDDEEDENLDKKMGDVEGEDSEKLDEKVWGSDSEEEYDDLKSEDDTGGASQNKQSELVAKDGKQKEDDYKNKKEQKPEEKMDDTQNDEYQGETPDPLIDAPPDKEPEIVEIPDDLEINDDDAKEGSVNNDDIEMMDADEKTNKSDDDADTDKEGEMSEGEDANANDKKDEKEAEVEDDIENVDSAEPYKGEDEGDNAEESKNDTNLPTDTPTTEVHALPSGKQNKSSTDPVETEEMDWESGSKQTEEQHKEGQAESQSITEQGSAHEGKKPSSVKQRGNDRMPKQKPSVSENRTVDRNASDENLKHRPLMDKQSDKKTLEDKADESDEAGAYEHVSKEEDGVAQSVDLATKEQAAVKLVSTEYDDVESEQEVIDISSSDEEKVEPPKNQGVSIKRKQQQKTGERGDAAEEKMDTVEGELVLTHTVPRGLESNIFTQHELWFSMSQKNIQEQRSRLENDLDLFISQTGEADCDNEAIKQWEKYERLVSNLAEELCEQLRLVLEPTKMSKLKGDYRTGKRLNMRKIIPYIASQFRKDKIWLRRTKPSKRQYQIMLAVDDSSSMADNHSKQLTFETLSVLGKSLSLLEAGELGVVSFGEKVDLLLGFQDTYDPNHCAKIFQKFSFSQQKTDIAQLLQYVTNTMMTARNGGAELAKETSQLLLILSDGRGIFSLGESEVRQAVRRARDNNVFMVFIIIDSPLNKDSILDIKSTEFGKDGVTFKPYIESFPFPFYIILREISALPVVLGEALRQWFELVTSIER